MAQLGIPMESFDHRSSLPGKAEPPNCNDTFPPSESALPTPPTQPSLENASVKPEPREMSFQPLMPVPPIPSDIPDPSDVLSEVNRLDGLSSSIHIFKRRFDELQNHLDFIDKAIEARSKELAETASTSTTVAKMAPSAGIINARSKTQVNPEIGLKEDKISESNEANLRDKSQTDEGDVGGSVVDDELKSLCKLMSGRGLRKYLVSYKSDTRKLREQVPLALKIAPNPAKLVLECVGRFYLQGSRAYSSQRLHMISGRDAAILVLECFLLSGFAENENALNVSVRDEAKAAAIAWRNRLVSEGGVSKAGEIDARGLLMLVASFGIPAAFKDKDIADLIRLSNAREASHVLRKSNALRGRIPDIIGRMMKTGLIVEAVDIAYTFGHEDKFSPRKLLTSFLQKSEQAWKKARQEGTGSFHVLKEAYEKHLSALKSVLKCLEGHKIDWTELLPECQIKEKIANLMKDIADLKRKMEEKASLKRKVDKIESSNKLEILGTKRPNFATTSSETKIYDGLTSSLVSPSVTASQGYRIAAYTAGRSLHDVSVATSIYEAAGHSSQLNYYPVSLAAQVGTGVSAGMRVIPAASNLIFNGDLEIDHLHMKMDHNHSTSRRYAVEEAASCNDRFVEQSLVDQLALPRANGMYGQLASLKGFAGLPNGQSANMSTTSDLHSFADAIVEDQSVHRYDSIRGGHLPSIARPHHPSYA